MQDWPLGLKYMAVDALVANRKEGAEVARFAPDTDPEMA